MCYPFCWSILLRSSFVLCFKFLLDNQKVVHRDITCIRRKRVAVFNFSIKFIAVKFLETFGCQFWQSLQVWKISMEMHAGKDNNVNSRYAVYDVKLSKIISFENVRRSLVERTAGTLLRPVSCILVWWYLLRIDYKIVRIWMWTIGRLLLMGHWLA